LSRDTKEMSRDVRFYNEIGKLEFRYKAMLTRCKNAGVSYNLAVLACIGNIKPRFLRPGRHAAKVS